MTTNAPDERVVDAVTAIVNDDTTSDPVVAPAEIRRVIVAYEALKADGPPEGTIMRTDRPGEIAVRVNEPGLGPCWKVTALGEDGRYSQHTDLTPTLAEPWQPM